MKTKCVNIISGPGAGKSIFSAIIFAELKMMHKTAELVPEHAKWLIYKGEEDKLADQYIVSTEQYNMMKVLDNKVEYILADSGLVTGLYYNSSYNKNHSNIEKTKEMIQSKMKEFTNIYIFLERGEYPFEESGRIHTEQESIQIDIQLRALLDENNIEYLSVKSCKTSIPRMLEYILVQKN